jgi:processing peptidase subunit alpha
MKSHFIAPNMVLAAAGVEHEHFTALAEKYLKDVPALAPPGSDAPIAGAFTPPLYVGGEKRIIVEDAPLSSIALAFEAGGWHDDDLVPVCVLHTLLGGGDSFSAGGPGKGKIYYYY